MSEPQESHSSKKAEITRVKSRKKQAKKTVGITLPPQLLAEARKNNLNISRITGTSSHKHPRIPKSPKSTRKL